MLAVALCVLGTGPWRVNRRIHSRRRAAPHVYALRTTVVESDFNEKCLLSRAGPNPHFVCLVLCASGAHAIGSRPAAKLMEKSL